MIIKLIIDIQEFSNGSLGNVVFSKQILKAVKINKVTTSYHSRSKKTLLSYLLDFYRETFKIS